MTMTRDEGTAVLNILNRHKRLDFDARIWDRFQDGVNEQFGQVAGGTRRAGKVTLSASVGVDSDGIPCVKLTMDQGSKRVGVWNSAEGGQLTLEGL